MKFVKVESRKLEEPIIFGSDYKEMLYEFLVPQLDTWQREFIKGICEKGITTERQLDKYIETVNTKASKFINVDTGETLSSILLKYLYCDSI